MAVNRKSLKVYKIIESSLLNPNLSEKCDVTGAEQRGTASAVENINSKISYNEQEKLLEYKH